MINDLMNFWQLSGVGLQNEPPLSFYGVYDGHAGKDAAAFAASHLHGRILGSPYYPTDPVLAIKDAFNKTDQVFLEKGQKEVRNPKTFYLFINMSGINLFNVIIEINPKLPGN